MVIGGLFSLLLHTNLLKKNPMRTDKITLNFH